MKTQNYLSSSKFLMTVVAVYFCIMQASMAQYHPFPAGGAMWKVGWDETPKCKRIDYFSYKDTLVNNKIYTQVIASIENYWCQGPPIDTTFGYKGAYRNDTIAKKVYWLQKDSITENLLYSFDVKVGDTLPQNTFNFYGITNTVVVTSLDSVLLKDGTYRSAYWASFPGQVSPARRIIEGIGSEGGLIEILFEGISNHYLLECFTEDTVILFPTWSINCSPNIPNGFITIENNLIYNISPNPNTGIFKLPKEYRIGTIQIYNAYGQQIPFTKRNNELDITTQPAGLYFVMINDGEKNYVSKVVKE